LICQVERPCYVHAPKIACREFPVVPPDVVSLYEGVSEVFQVYSKRPNQKDEAEGKYYTEDPNVFCRVSFLRVFGGWRFHSGLVQAVFTYAQSQIKLW
jgi:hypothetical protein